jgi:hypothetical protein
MAYDRRENIIHGVALFLSISLERYILYHLGVYLLDNAPLLGGGGRGEQKWMLKC